MTKGKSESETCEGCGKTGYDIYLRFDPFITEGILIGPKVKWCSDCFRKRQKGTITAYS